MKRFLVVLFTFLLSYAVVGQEYSTTNKKAIKSYQKAEELLKARDFDNGIIELEKSVKIDSNFIEPRIQLASIYEMFKKEDQSLLHYEKVYELTKGNEKYVGLWKKLGDYYMDLGEYQKAITCYEDFVKYSPLTEPAIDLKIASAKFAIEAMSHPLDFTPEALPSSINRFQYQSNPVLVADESLLIYSVRGGNGRGYNENIVISQNENGEWSEPKSISNNINTEFNEGFASISGDGKVLVFTSCNKKDGQGSCDLYISRKKGNDWSLPENLGPKVNSPAWESGASLSADGRTLYFSSERSGGVGRKDIWMAKISEGGEWGDPVNLGDSINTVNNEVTPFIHSNGVSLYFASDGYPGMGGYDLYTSNKLDNGSFSSPENLGYPVNTKNNEGSLFITPNFEWGYFEKFIREEQREYSLLYKVALPTELMSATTCTYTKGIVTDVTTKRPIGTDIELFDLESNQLIQKVVSDDSTGEYLVVLAKGKNYGLFVERPGYLFFSKNFDTAVDSISKVNIDIELVPLTIGEKVVLNNVFFEKRSAELNDKSKSELTKLAALIQKNPSFVFQIDGHTDNVGTIDYNQELSEQRTASVKAYLLSLGVNTVNVVTKGYGETKPVASNDTEEGKALNRRTEVLILKQL